MPPREQQKSKVVSTIVVAIGVCVVVLILLGLWMNQNAVPPVVENTPVPVTQEQGQDDEGMVPVDAPAENTNMVAVATQTAAPITVPLDIQAKIIAITSRVDKGEITREEAQIQVNVLLGI